MKNKKQTYSVPLVNLVLGISSIKTEVLTTKNVNIMTNDDKMSIFIFLSIF